MSILMFITLAPNTKDTMEGVVLKQVNNKNVKAATGPDKLVFSNGLYVSLCFVEVLATPWMARLVSPGMDLKPKTKPWTRLL